VSTFAGQAGARGFADGKGSAARFIDPRGLACDGAGNVFVADGDAIRKITPDGTVSTLTSPSNGYLDGPVQQAKFNHPYAVAVDSNGTLFVTDSFNYVIRKIATNGIVSTVAGTANMPGAPDGVGAAARFGALVSITVDASGNLFVIDNDAGTLRRMAPDGTVTTVAGSAAPFQYRDRVGNNASFVAPSGLAFDQVSGAVFVVDSGINAIRRFDLSTAGVTTYAGSVPTPGFVDGPALDARFTFPHVGVFDAAGNLFITHNHSIRKITPAGVVSTFAGDSQTPGAVDATGTAARFSYPDGLAIDPAGNLFVGDSQNNTIRKVTPAGVVTTVAGSPGFVGLTNGTGSAAHFSYLANLAFDTNGNLFIADPYNHVIRKMDTSGVVSTFAGSGSVGFDNGPAATATFILPFDIGFDSNGALFVADYSAGTIRKVANGQVSTVSSSLHSPTSVAVAPDGRIYAADFDTIVRIEPSGALTNVAGLGGLNGNVDGMGTEARLGNGATIRFDSSGRLLLFDATNHAIRTGTFGTPSVRSFNAGAGDVTHAGDAATLTWSTTGLSVTIDGVSGTFPATGSTVVHPSATTTYHLTVTGDGGTASAIATVYVGNPPPHRAVAHR